LAAFSVDKDQPGVREVTVARLDTLAGMLPGRWIGYDAVETIVLDTTTAT